MSPAKDATVSAILRSSSGMSVVKTWHELDNLLIELQQEKRRSVFVFLVAIFHPSLWHCVVLMFPHGQPNTDKHT
jgi:hypothetical protein